MALPSCMPMADVSPMKVVDRFVKVIYEHCYNFQFLFYHGAFLALAFADFFLSSSL